MSRRISLVDVLPFFIFIFLKTKVSFDITSDTKEKTCQSQGGEISSYYLSDYLCINVGMYSTCMFRVDLLFQ